MGKHTKWRLERKESLSHKLTKEHTYRQFTRLERGMILTILAFSGTMLFAFGYYQLNVAPFLPNGSQRNDPFTQVWNGSITDSPTGPFGPPKLLASYIHAGFSGAASQTQAITVASGNLIVVSITQSNSACSTATVTDTQGNTIGGSGQYGRIGQQSSNNLVCVQTRWAFASASGADTITVLTGGTNGQAFQVLVYTGVATLPQAAGVFTGQVRTIAQFPAFATSGFTLLTFNPFSANSIVFEIWAQSTDFGCATANSGTTISVNKNCQNGATQVFSDYTWSSNSHPKVNQNITWSEGGSDSLGENTIAALAFEIPSLTPMPCPHGYLCSNAGVDASNLLNLFANSTNPGLAISSSPIDFSSAASKELFWFETWNNNTNIVAQPLAWFLTTNQTLATQTGYNPLNDPSVILINIVYPNAGASTIKSYYNYQAKTAGQSLLSSSGAGTNPFPTCGQTSTLFICSQGNGAYGASFKDFSMTMNYTGTAPGATLGSAGASLTCSDSTPGVGPNTYDFCLSAYASFPCTAASGTTSACSTRVFPFLNVNAGPYYIGYWSATNQTGNILFGTSNSGAFDRRANMAFVWVPNPCGGTAVNCTQSTTDTGGFFGWLGHQIGNTFSVVGNTLGGLLSPVLSFGGSLLGSLYSGFVQAVGILIQTYVTVLNFVGNLLHLGNLGDLLLSLLITVGLLITTGLSTLVSWFTTVGTFLTSGWLTFLAGAAGLVPTLLGIALTLWNFVFNANFNVKTLLFADYMIVIIATWKKGLAGFFAWISLNVFLFTFVFNLAWAVFDIITRPIHRAKETVDPVG